MSVVTAAVTCALLVLAYAAAAGVLLRWNVSAPLAFAAAGGLLGAAGAARTGEEVVWVRLVVDLTLALLLFHDAAQVPRRELGAVRGLVLRLLLFAWPLTVLAGFLTLRIVFPDQSWALALFVASALAPTDAGLGAATLLNPAVPVRVRALLNVESGLNDGLAAPVALFAIAALAGADAAEPGRLVAHALGELAAGAGVGAATGVAGALALGWSRERHLSTASSRTLGVLSLPVLAYGTAELAGGNGFVAAFVAGVAFALAASWLPEEHGVFTLTEATAELLGCGLWLLFGMVTLPLLWELAGWRQLLVALLSLTVLRMVPVALSLVGSGLRFETMLFLGWSGPRGLVSVAFTLLALESLQVDSDLRKALLTVALTVVLSMVAHGVTAAPLARRYGAWAVRHPLTVELGAAVAPRSRGWLVRRADQ